MHIDIRKKLSSKPSADDLNNLLAYHWDRGRDVTEIICTQEQLDHIFSLGKSEDSQVTDDRQLIPHGVVRFRAK